MADMPFGSACNDHFSFNGRLAALTSWTEEFVEVEMAEESNDMRLFIPFGSLCKSLVPLCLGLLVKSDTFKSCLAMVADETLRMEA